MSARLAPVATASPPVAVRMDSEPLEQREATSEATNTCRYPSKKCWGPRALKRNGELHNLCDLHRQKANKNQRRLELKRKTKKIAAVKRTRKSRKKKQPATIPAIAPIKAQPVELLKQAPAPAVMPVDAPALLPEPRLSTLPTGFFTDLMMADSFQTKQLDTTMAMPSHSHFQPLYQPPQLNLTPELLANDLDTLAECLDSIPSLATMLGNSSPIDVCEGFVAAAAVTGSDFWAYPVIESNGLDSLFMDATLIGSDGSLAFHP